MGRKSNACRFSLSFIDSVSKVIRHCSDFVCLPLRVLKKTKKKQPNSRRLRRSSLPFCFLINFKQSKNEGSAGPQAERALHMSSVANGNGATPLHERRPGGGGRCVFISPWAVLSETIDYRCTGSNALR